MIFMVATPADDMGVAAEIGQLGRQRNILITGILVLAPNATASHAAGALELLRAATDMLVVVSDPGYVIVPRSCRSRCFTFSRRIALGRLAAMISLILKKRVPCVGSLNPCALPRLFFFETPAIEKGWQGKPATRMSWSGMSAILTLRMSPSGTSPYHAQYVF